MYAIRGATTLNCNTKEEIIAATVQLFECIKTKNGIDEGDMISVRISTTKDITAFYPAAALRENGLDSVPLFSSLEPDISGALKLCVRLLVNVDKPKPQAVKHIYLRNAAALRPDLQEVTND